MLHGVPWFLPESIGGTEVYVASLVAAMERRGVDGAVAVFRAGGSSRRYRHQRVEVREIAVSGHDSRGLGESIAAFREWVKDFDLYHQHAWTSACNAIPLRAAREAGCATVFTAHVPDVHCLSGTMIRDAEAPCDGRIDKNACARCWAIHRGLPSWLAGVAASPVAARTGELAGAALPRRAVTALSAREFVAGKQRQLAELALVADEVVAVCEWLRDALAANGLPIDRLRVVRQGLAEAATGDVRVDSRVHPEAVRIGYLGRCTAVKGIDVAIKAFRALDTEVAATFDLHFPEPVGGADAVYAVGLRRLAEGDRRIRFAGPLAPDSVARALAELDIVVVPSHWMETGPLVVLEALAAGAAVIGSDRGGIAELAALYPGVVPATAGDVRAWTSALHDTIVTVRRRNSRPRVQVRTMDDVARDMLPVYEAALAHRQAAPLAVGTSH